MPLQITDPHFGDKEYYADRREMLGKLNTISNAAYVDFPEEYEDVHKRAAQLYNQVLDSYPEHKQDLIDRHTAGSNRGLNIAQGMGRNPVQDNIAELGAKGSAHKMRFPWGYEDEYMPIKDESSSYRSRGKFNPNNKQVILPMRTMQLGSAGDTVVKHELAHAGFDKLPPEQRLPNDVEHNIIYNIGKNKYGSNDYSIRDIHDKWPISSVFTDLGDMGSDFVRQAASDQLTDEYQGLAGAKLGTMD